MRDSRVYQISEINLSDRFSWCLTEMLDVLKTCEDIDEIILFCYLAKGNYTDDSAIAFSGKILFKG